MIREEEFRDLMDTYMVQQDLRPGIGRYLFYGIKPGNFLYLMLTDAPISEVMAVADHTRTAGDLRQLTHLFHNDFPSQVWGSIVNVEAHIKAGGPNTSLRRQIEPVEEPGLSDLLKIEEPT